MITPGRYAAETDVAVSKSKAQIEALLIQHGAKDYASGWSETHDRLQFTMRERTIRFALPRPDRADRWISHDRNGRARTAATIDRVIEQLDRQRWRALYLVIRAKIEAVEAGIAVFEQEFLAFIVGPGGLTIGDILVPRLATGTLWKALPETTEEETNGG